MVYIENKWRKISFPEAIELAQAAYINNETNKVTYPDGWNYVDLRTIKFSTGSISSNGLFYSIASGYSATSSADVAVFKNGNNLVISFRGTEPGTGDWTSWDKIRTGYIDYYADFLKKIYDIYKDTVKYTFVGHSLGGAAVNQLSLNLKKYADFSDADLVAVASPFIGSDKVLNFGFDNDLVYEMVTLTKNHISGSDNTIAILTQNDWDYGNINTTVHSSTLYKDAAKDIYESSLFSLMEMDSNVFYIGSSKKIIAKRDAESKYYLIDNQFFIGNYQGNYIITDGGSDNIDLRGGNDTVMGGKGADKIYGGTGNDIFRFVSGDVVKGEIIDGGGLKDEGNRIAGHGKIDFSVATIKAISEILFEQSGTFSFSASQFSENGISPRSKIFASSGADQLIFHVGTNSAKGTIDLSGLRFDDKFAWSAADKIQLLGFGQDDTIIGTSKADSIEGRAGNDALTGGVGNDIIDGGAGTDFAYYDGNFAQYVIAQTGENQGYIRTVSGKDVGRDFLSNVEYLVFRDKIYNWRTGEGTDYAYNRTVSGSTTAIFTSPSPNDAVVTGVGTSSFSWGSGSPSSLAFAGTSFKLKPGEKFKIGTLTYHNGTIDGDSGADSITFKASISFTDASGLDFTVSTAFTLVNTPNSSDPKASADTVTIGNFGYSFNVLEDETAKVDIYASFVDNFALLRDGKLTGVVVDPFGLKVVGLSDPTSGGFIALDGDDEANLLEGSSSDDTISGFGGNDTLLGGKGADTLIGGKGNDTYVIDHANDTVTEEAGEGTDLVKASVSYTLSENTENLTLTGSRNINGIGNQSANRITGNSGNNVLDGMLGIDILAGGKGNDLYIVDHAKDKVTEKENEGNDRISASVSFALSINIENLTLTGSKSINGTGNSLGNRITGNSASNVLNGKAGADTLAGGLGNDTYIVDSSSDKVLEKANEGGDLVKASVSYILSTNVEDLTLTGSKSINGTGNNLNNRIAGNSLNNVLDGKAGADVLAGGAGSDIYIVENAGDVVSERANAGIDLVKSSVSYTLSANVENLTLSGERHISGVGNSLANKIIGNARDNILEGKAGADTLFGGAGNDIFQYVSSDDAVGDKIDGGSGIDAVLLFGNTDLSDLDFKSIETFRFMSSGYIFLGEQKIGKLTVIGAGNNTFHVTSNKNVDLSGVVFENMGTMYMPGYIDGGDSSQILIGSGVADRIRAGGGADLVRGGAGDDSLVGGDGNDGLYGDAGGDVLSGGAGNDKLAGGAGRDHLYGDAGKDRFVFASIKDSIIDWDGRDTIYDFDGKAGDRIDFAAIDANTNTKANNGFVFIGTKSFSNKAGELRYDRTVSDTNIFGDTNGDGIADIAIHLEGEHALSKGYFLL